EHLGHELAAGDHPLPQAGVTGGQVVAGRLVGEHDAVLDVRRVVDGAGGGDDVEPQRHSRGEHHVGAGVHRGARPLVEVNEVAGVDVHAEERVTEPLGNQVVELAAGDADADRFVPLGGAREVRRDQALDVVPGRGGQVVR